MSATLHCVMFQRVFGFGTVRAQKVIDVVGHPSELFALSINKVAQMGFLTPRELSVIRDYDKLEREGDKSLCKAAQIGCAVLTPDSDEYPQRLRDIYSPPSVLYVLGHLTGVDDTPAIGIVGTRKYTEYGKRVADDLSRQLVARGVIIVSGLATGIDTVSHIATLKAGGRTIAVLGNGLDTIYPFANTELHGLILKNGGAVVSEFPPGETPLPFHFPIRNRIISGLSLGIVVVEGTRHSGSLITAGHAVTQDKDVFAVPGDIYSPMSQATNWLISQGATPVTCAQDIVNQYSYISFLPDPSTEPAQISFDIPGATVYNGQKKHKTVSSAAKPLVIPMAEALEEPESNEKIPAYLNDNQRRVLMQLGRQPVTSDAIATETGLSVSAILAALTQLEIFGFVETCAGRRFIRKK